MHVPTDWTASVMIQICMFYSYKLTAFMYSYGHTWEKRQFNFVVLIIIATVKPIPKNTVPSNNYGLCRVQVHRHTTKQCSKEITQVMNHAESGSVGWVGEGRQVLMEAYM